jgi:hypothetical protein
MCEKTLDTTDGGVLPVGGDVEGSVAGLVSGVGEAVGDGAGVGAGVGILEGAAVAGVELIEDFAEGEAVAAVVALLAEGRVGRADL